MAVEAWQVRVGDRVRLMSGGVVMTAERVSHGVERSFARCVWFDARQALHRAFIALDALDLVTPDEFPNTDCPEARMAGGNNNNNKLR